MLFIAVAFALYFVSVSYRYALLPSPVHGWGGTYWILLAICLAADLMASYGFFTLFRVTPTPSRSYTAMITGLSLVAAAIIIGKFAFFRRGPGREQRFLAWASSTLLIFVLYLLFGSIAFFSAVVSDYNFAPLLYAFIPAVMLSILWINTVYEHWDYADQNE